MIGDTSSFIFNGTGLASGAHLTNLVGYEADRLYFNAPVGNQQITHSPYAFTDGTLNYSDITYYQAGSGARFLPPARCSGTGAWPKASNQPHSSVRRLSR